MTNEEKQLLLKDLCTRLPYHDLQVQYDNKDWLAIGYGHGRVGLLPNLFSSIACPCPLIEDIKPYLRPLERMTEEEINEFILISDTMLWLGDSKSTCILSLEQMDWLNVHHFDYRGLIEKVLALEAPEGMYKTE